MELPEPGQQIFYIRDRSGYAVQVPKIVAMTIKAPRGWMILYQDGRQDTQCRAIKAFMEQHNG